MPALLVPTLPALASPAPTLEVVSEGLDNPRGLTIGKDGTVYVAEAGRGGDDCRELPPQGGIAGTACFGLTGSIYVSNYGYFPGQGQVVLLSPA